MIRKSDGTGFEADSIFNNVIIHFWLNRFNYRISFDIYLIGFTGIVFIGLVIVIRLMTKLLK